MAIVVAGRDRIDGAHAQGTEGAGAEGAQGIEGGDDGVGVLEEQAARGGEGQDGAERSVKGFDLDLTIAGEAVRTLEREREEGREGKIVLIGQVDIRGFGVRDG